nr:mandelate racemase/muconate lactonizing enzyme family protein [Halococcus agarilyticus]
MPPLTNPTTSKYSQFVDDMLGGVGWRDLQMDGSRRDDERDIEITDVRCVVIEGNFPWNLIKVETSAGEYGLGEAFPGPASEYIEFLRPGLVGQNPFDIDRLTEHMTQLLSGLGGSLGYSQAAVSGIETALFDVVGKLVDLPAYQLMGGKYRDAVRIYCDCHAGEALAESSDADPREIYSPASYADAAREVIDEGFDALKFDLDVRIEDADTATRRLSNDAVEHKLAIVEAVREEIGADPALAFDLHWNFSVETAERIARGLEEYDLAWLEDPVPPEGVDSHRKVTAAASTPILAGENLTRVEGFLPFLTEQAVDIIAPDLQKAGGLLEFRKIATVADAFDMPVAPHNISSPVGTMASVHACATVPNAFALEWHAREVEWWDDLLVREEPLIEDGEIAVPEAPGLGIELDTEVAAEHTAPGEEMFEL